MDFNILEARCFLSDYYSDTTRLIKDYEIDMERESGRIYSYDCTNEFTLFRGDIVVKKPSSTARTVGIQNGYMLTLDFSCKKTPLNYSRNIPGEIQTIFENENIMRLEPIIHPVYTNEISNIYRSLISLSDRCSEPSKELVRELIYMLNAEISRKNYEVVKPQEIISDKLISYLRDNLDSHITLDSISKHLHLEKSYLIRLFKSETGKTPIEILIEMRLEKASDLIATTELSVNKVASECGYNTVSFFISEYKKRYGMTPQIHRSIIREGK